VAAGVVAHRLTLLLREVVQALQHLLDRLVGPLRAVERGVRVVDVRLVVQVVVDAHRLRVDVRLEGLVRVRQIRQFERHRLLLSSLP